MAKTLGFIGLGRMGRLMASNLARKGFNVVAFDESEEAVAAVVAAGCRPAASAADAASQSDVLFLMLPNASLVRSVVEEIMSELGAGGIVVNMSTIDPSVADSIARDLQSVGLGFIDAPVGRSALHADRGESRFMMGTAAEHLDRIRPMLEAMANPSL